ncbi:hypothetical protein L209DRAFT_538856 [Thermothelomyces heterothallicus CBS 203.75]
MNQGLFAVFPEIGWWQAAVCVLLRVDAAVCCDRVKTPGSNSFDWGRRHTSGDKGRFFRQRVVAVVGPSQTRCSFLAAKKMVCLSMNSTDLRYSIYQLARCNRAGRDRTKDVVGLRSSADVFDLSSRGCGIEYGLEIQLPETRRTKVVGIA